MGEWVIFNNLSFIYCFTAGWLGGYPIMLLMRSHLTQPSTRIAASGEGGTWDMPYVMYSVDVKYVDAYSG